MTEQTNNQSPLLSRKRVIWQLIGFTIGAALLVWCIKLAIKGGDWSKLADADPLLIAALLGCTCVSLFINGTTFWITAQPIKPMNLWDLQRLNLACNLLNYAPIRVGAIARVLYHMRIDKLSFLQVGAWFAAIVYIMAMGVGACLAATLIRVNLDWVWAVIVIGLLIAGGLFTRVIISHGLFAKSGQGVDRILLNQKAYWIATVLRLVDLGAFVGRMAAAVAILDLHEQLQPNHLVILAIIAFAARLIPLGRVGIAEAVVAALAAWLTTLGIEGSTVDAVINESGQWAQLALVESAGEALILIPTGAIALIWLRKRWITKSK